MSELTDFLEQNVEGYLFNDLREMQAVPVAYPLLMTTFAGVELLGALLSTSEFKAFNKGHEYFDSYWSNYLCPMLPNRKSIGEQLYQLVRHGVAHAFVIKGPIAVGRNPEDPHLAIHDGVLYLNAVKMAEEFIISYYKRLKPLVSEATGSHAVMMAKRLDEMKKIYGKQFSERYEPRVFPSGSPATSAAVSHSVILPVRSGSDRS